MAALLLPLEHQLDSLEEHHSRRVVHTLQAFLAQDIPSGMSQPAVQSEQDTHVVVACHTQHLVAFGLTQLPDLEAESSNGHDWNYRALTLMPSFWHVHKDL